MEHYRDNHTSVGAVQRAERKTKKTKGVSTAFFHSQGALRRTIVRLFSRLSYGCVR